MSHYTYTAYEKIDTNIDDAVFCNIQGGNEFIDNWCNDFEEIIEKFNKEYEKEYEDWQIYLYFNDNDGSIDVNFSNRTLLDDDTDEKFNAFLKNKALQNKLIDLGNELIAEFNQAVNNYKECKIPDNEFMYYKHSFYVEVYDGKPLYTGIQLIQIIDQISNVDWEEFY